MDEPGDMTYRDLERFFDELMPAEEDGPALRSFFKDFDLAYPVPSTSHLEAAHLSAIRLALQDPASHL